MDSILEYMPARPADIQEISASVSRIFDEFVGPDYPPEGRAEFKNFIAAEAMMERYRTTRPIAVVARIDGDVAGYIEMRGPNHIALLFVDKAYHGQGLARHLWEMARETALRARPDIDSFTVNASSYAVPVYKRFGFIATDIIQEKNGIRFIPMKMELR